MDLHGQFCCNLFIKGEINKVINLFNKILENQKNNKQLKLEAQKEFKEK